MATPAEIHEYIRIFTAENSMHKFDERFIHAHYAPSDTESSIHDLLDVPGGLERDCKVMRAHCSWPVTALLSHQRVASSCVLADSSLPSVHIAIVPKF